MTFVDLLAVSSFKARPAVVAVLKVLTLACTVAIAVVVLVALFVIVVVFATIPSAFVFVCASKSSVALTIDVAVLM